MSGFEWFLLIALVIVVPLVVAVAVTLWTLEQANKRRQQNRGSAAVGVKRQATRTGDGAATNQASGRDPETGSEPAAPADGNGGNGGGDGGGGDG